MWNRKRSVILSIAVCFAFLAILTVLVFAGPKIVEIWFTAYRGFDKNGFALNKMLVLFKACFYPCAIFAYVTLYSLIKLLLNIKKEEVMTIGDNVNDKIMIENAGCGVAMGNSAPYIKEIADIVVADNNQDGVAEAIEKI